MGSCVPILEGDFRALLQGNQNDNLDVCLESGVSVAVKVENLHSFARLCSQSDESLLLQLLVEFPYILVALYSNNQLMLLSLLKGLGSEVMLVEEVELFLNELLNRRHQFHLGNDQLCMKLPKIEVDTMCLLLEVIQFQVTMMMALLLPWSLLLLEVVLPSQKRCSSILCLDFELVAESNLGVVKEQIIHKNKSFWNWKKMSSTPWMNLMSLISQWPIWQESSIIRVKKPSFFKGKGQFFNKDNNWKRNEKYTSDSKNGYKTGSIDRSKISWEDSDNDADEEVGNYALMALEQGKCISENKLKYASEIKAVLRENLEKNEVKLKSFKNTSELIGQYQEKNKPCANTDIGLDYDALNSKNKNIVNFSEEELIIKQEIADEDNEKKDAEATQSFKTKRSSWIVKGKLKKVIWIIDIGCSRYMIGDKALLSQFEEKAGPLVTFGDNSNGFTMGYGQIISENVVIDDVALVASLEVNLLSVSQFADKERKIKRSSHKSKTVNSISAPLQLIHMDLFGPVNVLSISRNKYALVMVDDFSRYTWVEFMHSKDETPYIIIQHIKKIENQAEDHNCVKRLKSDNGTEFRNATLSEFCKNKYIVQEF
ncbi:hypothetical protein AgCh_003606 [Apium graveolens]